MSTNIFGLVVLWSAITGVGVGGLLVTGWLWLAAAFDDWRAARAYRDAAARRLLGLTDWPERPRIEIPARWR